MKEKLITMADGFTIYALLNDEVQSPVRGHLHILHGMAEHINRYKPFMEYLAKQGIIVSGHDHRGHGNTAKQNGKLGYLAAEDGFSRIVKDSHEVIAQLRQEYHAPKFFLLGHSMGSFAARRYIQQYGDELDSVLLLGTGGDPGIMRPAGEAAAYLSGKKNGFEKPDIFLNQIVFNGYNKKITDPQTVYDWLSSDEDEVRRYMEDPYCGFVPTTRFFMDLFEGLKMINSKSEIAKVPKQLPILLLSGDKDPVGNYGKGVWQTAEQYDEAGVENVTVMLYENGRHEMLNEKNREDVYRFLNDWVSSHGI